MRTLVLDQGFQPHRVVSWQRAVLMLFDGLGAHQLEHPIAAGLRSARAATLDAPFPTTTTVSSPALGPSETGNTRWTWGRCPRCGLGR